jgi:Rod binding domain-containing protein
MGTSMGLGSLGTQTSALDSAADRAIQGIKSTRSANDSAKIDKGAKEFESVLVGSWLQQAEQSFATVPGADDDDSQDVGKSSIMSFGTQTLATAMASSGGIGIAKMVAKAMHAAADKEDGAAAAATDVKASPATTLVPGKRTEEKRAQ